MMFCSFLHFAMGVMSVMFLQSDMIILLSFVREEIGDRSLIVQPMIFRKVIFFRLEMDVREEILVR